MRRISLRQFIFLLMFAVGILGLLYYEQIFNGFQAPPSADPMGRVGKIEGTARVRRFDQLHWQDLSNDDPVFSGDYLLTLAKSHLRLSFEDKRSVIELGENSFVRVSLRRGRFVLEVKGGSFQSDSQGKNLEIKKMEGFQLPLPTEPTPLAVSTPGTEASPVGKDAPEATKPAEEKKLADASGAKTEAQGPVYSTSPKEDSVILYSKSSDLIHFSLNQKSHGDGMLIFTPATRAALEFAFTEGQEVRVDLKVQDVGDGALAWTFKDMGKDGHGNFFVEKFSAQNMRNALSKNKNVEVLQ